MNIRIILALFCAFCIAADNNHCEYFLIIVIQELNIFNKFNNMIKERSSDQKQPMPSLRFTLDPSQNNQQKYQVQLPITSTKTFQTHLKPQNHNNNNNNHEAPQIDPLTQSHELHRQFKYISHHTENQYRKKPTHLGSLLKKNKSNHHIQTNVLQDNEAKQRLLSPPILANSLRSTIELGLHSFKAFDKKDKQIISQHNKQSFKKDKKIPAMKSPDFLQKRARKRENTMTHHFKQPSTGTLKNFDLIHQIHDVIANQAHLCVEKETGSLWTIKRFDKQHYKNNTKILDELIRELRFQYFTSHPNIIQLYGIFDDQNYLYVLQEFMEGRTLKSFFENRVQKLKEEQLAQYASEICSGLHAVHEKVHHHGRISLEEIMVVHGTCKLATLKHSVIEDPIHLCTKMQTLAPEVFLQRIYDKKSDMWSMGIVLYQLWFNTKPFSGPYNSQLLKCIARFKEQKLQLKTCPYQLKNIIKSLLKFKREKRADSSQLKKQTLLQANTFEKEWKQTATVLGYDPTVFNKQSQKFWAKDIRSKSPSFLKKRGNEKSHSKIVGVKEVKSDIGNGLTSNQTKKSHIQNIIFPEK